MDNSALTDHSYDGIQEYDNPLPGWWKWLFVATIVFSVFYAMYYHIGAPGRSRIDGYENAMRQNMEKQFAELGDLKPDAATLAKYARDDSWSQFGAGVYKSHCVSCHGQMGQGQIGPNLTDEYYKNVRKIVDIADVVTNGAGNGAMPAWGNRLNEYEIIFVSAYVASLRGQNIDGKGPDGVEIPPWPDPEDVSGDQTDDASGEGEASEGSEASADSDADSAADSN